MNWKALERVLDELRKCEKGCCQAPATRDASYTSGGAVVATQPSCDEHGVEPTKDYDYAAELRQVTADANAAGFTFWWQDPTESKGDGDG